MLIARFSAAGENLWRTGYFTQVNVLRENLAAKCFRENQSGSETILAILTVQFFTKDPNTVVLEHMIISQFAKTDSHQNDHLKVKKTQF